MFRILFVIALFVSALNAQPFVEVARLGEEGKAPGQFRQPLALDVTSEGKLVVVDSGNDRLQVFDLKGRLLRTAGGFGFGEDQFNHPVDVWARTLINMYVSDYNNQRVVRLDRNFRFLSELKSQDAWDADFQFSEVLSCAINSQNDLFVLDRGESKIVKINRRDQPERIFGTYESGPGALEQPVQLDIFNDNYLLVSDAARAQIIIFDFFGTFISALGDSLLKAPAGLAADDRFGIIVCDPASAKILRIHPDLKTISVPELRLTRLLRHPTDAALVAQDHGWLLYILDQNQLIILRQNLP